MTAVAAVACATMVWLLMVPQRSRADLSRVLHVEQPAMALARHRSPLGWTAAVLVAAVVVATFGVTVRVLLAGAVVAAMAVMAALRAARRRGWRHDRHQVCEGAQVLASQLQAGQLPVRALAIAAQSSALLEPAAATVAIGGDVAQALRRTAARPGCGGLETLAAAWELAQRSGAPVAALIARVAEQQREELRLQAVVAGELAAPRATGLLLSLLPALGIAMAAMVGVDPVQFLTGTEVGSWCLLAAAGLNAAGVTWTEWLARGEGER